jgi:hypothetical protein
MPFAFEERVAAEHQLKTIPTPWAIPGTLRTGEAHTRDAGDSAVRTNARFHHYYKKHMTLLGLRKALDSSDTDSETSTNFQTKMFRRRRHPLKKLQSVAEKEAADLAARTQARPWQQLVPPLSRIGLTPLPDDDEDRRRLQDGHHKGKRVTNFDSINEQLDGPPARIRLSAAEQHRIAVSLPRTRTSIAGAWEQREVMQQTAKVDRRRNERPSPLMFAPPTATPHPLEAEERRAMAEVADQRRSKTSMGGATAMQITRTVRKLRQDHRESMGRHRMIMAKVGPCGAGSDTAAE